MGYTLEEFIAVFNRNLGNVEDLVKKKKELKKRLGILGKRIGGVKGSITRRFGKEGEDTFDLIDKLGKKLEEQSDSYDYKGKTDYTREQIVENYNKISKDFRNWLGLFSQEARRSDIVKEKYNKFLDKTFGGKVPEDFTVRQLGDYLAAQKQIANRQKNQQPQAVNKPEISKPEPVKKATEPMPNAKDNIIRQIATEVSYNPKKYEDNAKAILEQLGKVPEYKNKVKQWETDLKAGLAKGDPTSAIANIILEGREYNRKKKAAQNEEKDAMKLFQLDK